MHRRPLGRGRQLAALASILIVAACLLPWWRTSDEGLPAMSGNAFAGSGILVFFVALAVVALLALPYAAGDVPIGVDRPLSFVIILAIGWIAFAVRAFDLAMTNLDAVLPLRAPGLWLAALGLILLSRAVYDIAREPRF